MRVVVNDVTEIRDNLYLATKENPLILFTDIIEFEVGRFLYYPCVIAKKKYTPLKDNTLLSVLDFSSKESGLDLLRGKFTTHRISGLVVLETNLKHQNLTMIEKKIKDYINQSKGLFRFNFNNFSKLS